MASRPGVIVDHRVAVADSGPRGMTGAALYDPAVSIHVRAYWHPDAEEAVVLRALADAYESAVEEVQRRRLAPPSDGRPREGPLHPPG